MARENRQPVSPDNPFVGARAPGVATDRAGPRPIPRLARRLRRTPVQDDLRIAVARGGGGHRPRGRSGATARGRPPGSRRSCGFSSARRSRPPSTKEPLVDAWARLLLYLRPKDEPVDERPFNMVRRMIEESTSDNAISLGALREALKRQARVLALDEERAIAALPKLAPEQLHQRELDVARIGHADARRADAPAGRALSSASRTSSSGTARRRRERRHCDGSREVPAPPRGGPEARAGRDRGRPSLRRELALRRSRRRRDPADPADSRRPQGEDRGRCQAVQARRFGL